MSEKDSITDALKAVTSPISAAESTVKSARGLVKETYGLVEDVRNIAHKEAARYERIKEERDTTSEKATQRITQKVAAKQVQKAASEYNAAAKSNADAAKAMLIKKYQVEQEQSLIWSMSNEEREAYLAEKKRQAEEAIKEKLRIVRENDARRDRNEMIVAVLFSVAFLVTMLWGLLLWLHHLTGAMPQLPGAKFVH